MKHFYRISIQTVRPSASAWYLTCELPKHSSLPPRAQRVPTLRTKGKRCWCHRDNCPRQTGPEDSSPTHFGNSCPAFPIEKPTGINIRDRKLHVFGRPHRRLPARFRSHLQKPDWGKSVIWEGCLGPEDDKLKGSVFNQGQGLSCHRERSQPQRLFTPGASRSGGGAKSVPGKAGQKAAIVSAHSPAWLRHSENGKESTLGGSQEI